MAVAGTNCYGHRGHRPERLRLPRDATQVNCSSRHTVTVTTQLQDVSLAGGTWNLWAQTPTSTYANAYGTG